MSAPDDPYASPPRDREAPAERPPAPARGSWPPPGGWGAPTGPPSGPPTGPPPGGPEGWPRRTDGPPPPPGSGGLGVASLVVGVLALVLGVSIVGGVVLGGLAVGLGLRARAQARATGRPSGAAVAGIVLGLLGFVAAGTTYLFLREPLTDYRACLRASTSFADDAACKDELKRRVEHL